MAGRRGTSPGHDDSYEDDYSDDFDDDATEVEGKRYKTRSPILRSDRSYRGRGRGRGGRMTGRMSTESKTDNITKRVLSARRLKINELQNSHYEAQQVIKDLKDEIKLLKKTQNRQDKALQRFEDRESDLPQLIQRQNNEVRSLRDQIRKWREKYEKTDRYLRDAEDDLEKVKTKLKKLKSLADEKDLPERGELNKKLNNQELEIEAKDVKIKELERYIQNLEKNHRHELGIERARQKDIKRQLQQIQEDNQKLNSTVEERTKELQMKNIYANRMVKPPHRLPNSYNGTPHGTPPPRRRRPSLSGADGVTPRERAKQMEEKRREEMRKQREIKQELQEQHEKMKRDEELRKRREQEDREREERDRERAERERHQQEQELEEKERELNEQARRDQEERKLRDERERMKRDADDRARNERERREREERERREKKEREERERKERREKEERERRDRERLEQERRAQEERRRFEDDVTLQAEKKKKDEILQKLREIDEGKNREKEKARLNDPFFITDTKEDSQDSMASSKKSYTFSKPIENLHKGKPSHNEALHSPGLASPSKSNRRHRDIDNIETGGYNPTFGGKTGGSSAGKGFSLFDDDEPKPKPAKDDKNQKSKLMAELFGSSDPPVKQNDIFAPSQSKKSETSTRPSFLWDDDSNAGRKNLTTKRENSATLFGGGSAFVNDEDLHKSQQRSNASFSRRQKQTTAFHSRPTVNAVDHFDDDIEEVIL